MYVSKELVAIGGDRQADTARAPEGNSSLSWWSRMRVRTDWIPESESSPGIGLVVFVKGETSGGPPREPWSRNMKRVAP